MVIAISPFLVILAIVQIVAVEALASPVLEELIHAPELESLGWNDGIMEGLLGDRRERHGTPASYSNRALDPFRDDLLLDIENSPEAGSTAFVDLIGMPVFADSVADPIRAGPAVFGFEVDCSLWDDGSIPCKAP